MSDDQYPPSHYPASPSCYPVTDNGPVECWTTTHPGDTAFTGSPDVTAPTIAGGVALVLGLIAVVVGRRAGIGGPR